MITLFLVLYLLPIKYNTMRVILHATTMVLLLIMVSCQKENENAISRNEHSFVIGDHTFFARFKQLEMQSYRGLSTSPIVYHTTDFSYKGSDVGVRIRGEVSDYSTSNGVKVNSKFWHINAGQVISTNHISTVLVTSNVDSLIQLEQDENSTMSPLPDTLWYPLYKNVVVAKTYNLGDTVNFFTDNEAQDNPGFYYQNGQSVQYNANIPSWARLMDKKNEINPSGISYDLNMGIDLTENRFLVCKGFLRPSNSNSAIERTLKIVVLEVALSGDSLITVKNAYVDGNGLY